MIDLVKSMTEVDKTGELKNCTGSGEVAGLEERFGVDVHLQIGVLQQHSQHPGLQSMNCIGAE